MIYKYEETLYNFFNEIVYVDSNPSVVNTQIIEKIDGEIKFRNIRESYELKTISINKDSVNLLSPECGNLGILDEIKSLGNNINIDFYPKNILQRLFSNKKGFLYKIIDEYTDSDSFIITCSEITTPKNIDRLVIDDLDLTNQKRLKDVIIIAKKSKIVLNKNLSESKTSVDVEFWINFSDYLVINLN